MRFLSLALAALLLLAPTAAARADEARTALHRRPSVHHGRRAAPVERHVHRRGCCHYTPGRYVTRVRRVVIPGHHVERVVPARYEVRWDSCKGGFVRIRVRSKRVVREWVPSRVEHRRVRVWVPGRWRCR